MSTTTGNSEFDVEELNNTEETGIPHLDDSTDYGINSRTVTPRGDVNRLKGTTRIDNADVDVTYERKGDSYEITVDGKGIYVKGRVEETPETGLKLTNQAIEIVAEEYKELFME